jgi:hypothetical protein
MSSCCCAYKGLRMLLVACSTKPAARQIRSNAADVLQVMTSCCCVHKWLRRCHSMTPVSIVDGDQQHQTCSTANQQTSLCVNKLLLCAQKAARVLQH